MITLSLLLGIVILICVIMLILVILLVIDQFVTNKETRLCQAVGRNYEPAYTYTTMMLVGDILVPQIHFVPDKWYIQYDYDDELAYVEVSKEFHDKYNPNWKHNIRKHMGIIFRRVVLYEYSD